MSHRAETAPVLSLTVVDATTLPGGVLGTETRVLAVVRSEINNPTHPNVVSVPTQRLPRVLMDEILESARPVSAAPTTRVAHFSSGVVSSKYANGHSPTLYAVEALLARKLGLAEGLESNRVCFRAALRARVDGVAVYDNLGPTEVREPVTMLNVVVALERFAQDLPPSTSSYSSIRWTPVDHLLRSIESRDPTLIDPEFDPIEVCLHGVCLLAAQATLSRALGQPVFEAEAQDNPVPAVVGSDASFRAMP